MNLSIEIFKEFFLVLGAVSVGRAVVPTFVGTQALFIGILLIFVSVIFGKGIGKK